MLGAICLLAIPSRVIALGIGTPQKPQVEEYLVAPDPQIVNKLYEQQIKENLRREQALLAQKRQYRGGGTNASSCVLYARSILGSIPTGIGVARNLKPNLEQPVVGAVAIEDLSRAGHLSVITEVGDDYFIVKEANYVPNTITSGRKIMLDSETLIGFYGNN